MRAKKIDKIINFKTKGNKNGSGNKRKEARFKK